MLHGIGRLLAHPATGGLDIDDPRITLLDLLRERREQARLALDERKVKLLEAKAALADAAERDK